MTEPKEFTEEQRSHVIAMGEVLLGMLDAALAPNYLEIPISDNDGKPLVVVTLQRPPPAGRSPSQIIAGLRVENEQLRGKLDAVRRLLG